MYHLILVYVYIKPESAFLFAFGTFSYVLYNYILRLTIEAKPQYVVDIKNYT